MAALNLRPVIALEEGEGRSHDECLGYYGRDDERRDRRKSTLHSVGSVSRLH